MLVDATDVYYLDVASAYAGLYRVPKTGGPPTSLSAVTPLQNDGTGWDFTLDGTTAYLTDRSVDMSGPQSNSVTIIETVSRTLRFVAPQQYGCTIPVVAKLAAFG
jgi:hypothetical protein